MKLRVGRQCVMDSYTPSAKPGVVASVPYKQAGEWFVEVDVVEEEAYGEGYRPKTYRVRIQTSRVSHG